MMLKMDDADGLVAGAINSTGNALRPALQIIKTAPGIISRFFLLHHGKPEDRTTATTACSSSATAP